MSNYRPKLSIIIPMYNAEKYIGECIDSILAQTFKDFELIIIDDCSIDNSAEIVKAYTDDRIIYHKIETNSGTARYPRFVGASMARSSTLSFLDADDLINDIFYESLFKLREQVDAEVISSQLYYFEGNIQNVLGILPDSEVPEIISGKDAVRLTIGQWKIGGRSLIPKEKWQAANNNNPDGQYINYDEIDQRILLLTINKIAYSKEAIYYYRLHSQSITHVLSAKSFDVIATNKHLYQLLKENFEKEDQILHIQENRLVKCTIHHLLKFNKNKSKFSKQERSWIMSLIYDNYKYIKANNLRCDKVAHNVLLSNYLFFLFSAKLLSIVGYE